MKKVTAAIVRRENCVLLMRRAPGQNCEGLWEFPGGKIEPGETPQACLEREMFEETGVRGRAGAFVAQSVYAYPGGEICLMAYEFEIEQGEIALTVHDDLCFVTPCEAIKMPLCPADVPIARALEEKMHEKAK